jgi:hypothetical protein
MRTILIIIFSLIIPVFSLTEIQPKLCVNCKFFKNDFISGNEYGKCYFFPKREMDIDLVTGIKKDAKYQFCSIARDYDDMCGKEGKKYINKRDDIWRFK